MRKQLEQMKLQIMARAGCCLAFALVTTSMAQTVIIQSSSHEDFGILYIPQPPNPIPGPFSFGDNVQWTESSSFTNVSIYAGLASYVGSATGAAKIASDSGTIAQTDFNFPNGSGQVHLFDGLSLPAGHITLTIGVYTGQDAGWGRPIVDEMQVADGVSYVGAYGRSYSFGPMEPLYVALDFTVISIPEPSSHLVLATGLMTIMGLRLRASSRSML
jgi:hypothetical protein